MDIQLAVSIVMLALTAWRESRGCPLEARVGVIMSILNRVDRPSWWGTNVLDVVVKKWQYSSLTDPKDPQLTTWPNSRDKVWQECLSLAQQAIDGHIQHPAPCADSYHDTSIAAPEWTKEARFVTQIGRIKFYDTDHDHEVRVVAPRPA